MRRTKTTHNRGTHLITVPIQFHIRSHRLEWQIVHKDGATLFVGGAQSGVTLENVRLGDGWDLVRQYLSVRPQDDQSILEFLTAHGSFEAPHGAETTHWSKSMQASIRRDFVVTNFFSIQDFATIQDYVRRMLITGNPTLPTPWQAGDIQRYEIAFANARSGPQAHVLVNGVFPSIFATVQFKLVQGATFRTCARKDCRLPFEVTSLHRRRFCTQYCAHITSLRQRRRLEGKGKK
jgi:hypothetical protein